MKIENNTGKKHKPFQRTHQYVATCFPLLQQIHACIQSSSFLRQDTHLTSQEILL